MRHTAANRYKDRFLGLAKSGLKTTPAPQWLRDFFVDTLDWQYDDDSPFENEDYKILIEEGLNIVGKEPHEIKPPSEALSTMIDDIWTDIDVPAILRSNQSIDFVRSMSTSDLELAHESLARVRRAIAHWSEVVGGNQDRNMRVFMEVRIMHGLVGPFIAKALIALNRAYPELPFSATIAVLYDHVDNVKSADLLHREDGTMYFSERVRSQWLTTKRDAVTAMDGSLRSVEEGAWPPLGPLARSSGLKRRSKRNNDGDANAKRTRSCSRATVSPFASIKAVCWSATAIRTIPPKDGSGVSSTARWIFRP